MLEAVARRPTAALGRYVAWVVLTYAGFALFGDTHLSVVVPTSPFHAADVAWGSAVVGFLFGATSGALIGTLQWLALRSWIPAIRGWIPATAVGFGLAHAWNDAVPYRPLDLAVVLVLSGLFVAAAQTIALRRAFARAWSWIPIATVAWLLGWMVAIALLGQIHKHPLAEALVASGAAGVIVGAITGAALLWLDGRATITGRPSE